MNSKLLRLKKVSLLLLGIIAVAAARFIFPVQENSIYSGGLIDTANADIPWSSGAGTSSGDGGCGDSGGAGDGSCGL